MSIWKVLTGQPAAMICPRCGVKNLLPACDNCENTTFTRGELSDGTTGFYCNACNIGRTWVQCQGGCGTNLPLFKFD